MMTFFQGLGKISSNWNSGVLEYWSFGSEKKEHLIRRLILSLISITPSLHHSITPVFGDRQPLL
jgi:hypothetical protein